ncbi:hypothetical protein ACIO1C_27035 [Streptomyces sp. NPDC087420]|uniref:hypothetical protein n=1 Tax=Streptomyces sp. NPDC087420 TaxID=3365785 RepID=UPI00383476BC
MKRVTRATGPTTAPACTALSTAAFPTKRRTEHARRVRRTALAMGALTARSLVVAGGVLVQAAARGAADTPVPALSAAANQPHTGANPSRRGAGTGCEFCREAISRAWPAVRR